MKKYLLIAFVIGSYILYGVHQRQAGSAAIVPPPVQSTPPTASGTVVTYKDGQYTGQAADAYYGNIQVKVTISGGKISNVEFLQSPSDRSTSVRINSQAMPFLKQEAIQAQSANVDGVSGATDTSQAFIQSLSSALKSAQSA
jgi:uncharacterized protein with FMN-binding domain